MPFTLEEIEDEIFINEEAIDPTFDATANEASGRCVDRWSRINSRNDSLEDGNRALRMLDHTGLPVHNISWKVQ